ncbi:MAG: 3-hydroxyacyl-CoA dehydrogenase NAD-binding domain-containing protein, partial [Flavitalea sp.]
QENGPERINIKQELFKQLDAYTPSSVLLVSSSSGIVPTIFQSQAVHPERILLGHPFNPPHLIPLVEVCGGEKTSEEAISRTIAFYASIGKKPIHLKKEVKGHVANRLQAALWQEAFHLVQQGVASVKDIDTAISEGPGLRWALLGPFMNLHLSGGDAGIRHMLEHLGPPMESWMRDLGKVSINDDLINGLTSGVDEMLKDKNLPELIAERDQLLSQIERLKSQTKELS